MHKKHQQVPDNMLYQRWCANIFLEMTEQPRLK